MVMYGSVATDEASIPRRVQNRNASVRAIVASTVISMLAVGLLVLAASGEEKETELSQQQLYFIPTNKPYPADVDDDRSWGDSDYNPRHGYGDKDTSESEILDAPGGYINPALAVAATGRVDEVARQGELSPEKTKTRNYEFPVFRSRTQQLAQV